MGSLTSYASVVLQVIQSDTGNSLNSYGSMKAEVQNSAGTLISYASVYKLYSQISTHNPTLSQTIIALTFTLASTGQNSKSTGQGSSIIKSDLLALLAQVLLSQTIALRDSDD